MTEPVSVAVELERLRGTMETGFAKTEGTLALLVQRSEHTEKAIDKHEVELHEQGERIGRLEATESAAADHESRLAALEKGRWPLQTVEALATVGAVVIALFALLH